MDDNEVSNRDLGYGWENPGTLNRSYGYNKYDSDWRSPASVIRMLVDIASNGGNYLLNIGPKADGTVPEPSVRILEEVGRWMDTSSESIYGTQPSPLDRPRWGRYTAKPGKLYVHVFRWPENGTLEIEGLKSNIKTAYMLADPEWEMLDVSSSEGTVSINLPSSAPDPVDSVVLLEVEK